MKWSIVALVALMAALAVSAAAAQSAEQMTEQQWVTPAFVETAGELEAAPKVALPAGKEQQQSTETERRGSRERGDAESGVESPRPAAAAGSALTPPFLRRPSWSPVPAWLSCPRVVIVM